MLDGYGRTFGLKLEFRLLDVRPEREAVRVPTSEIFAPFFQTARALLGRNEMTSGE